LDRFPIAVSLSVVRAAVVWRVVVADLRPQARDLTEHRMQLDADAQVEPLADARQGAVAIGRRWRSR
jgi:hypothetical protein